MKRGLLSALAGLAIFASGAAHGDVAVEVKVERKAPFDQWCVKPLCDGNVPRDALVKPPALVAVAAQQSGLLEMRLKRAISDALDAAARAVLGSAYDSALADLTEALAASALQDDARLAKSGGLGAATLRAALAYHFDSIVPTSGCTGPRRIDAIYEGLAASVALAPLGFPQKKARIVAACADTAARTARAVDAAALATIVPEALRRDVESTMKTIEATRKACAGLATAAPETLARVKLVDGASQAGAVTPTARALRAFRDAPAASSTSVDPSQQPSEAERACTAALDSLKAVDPAKLESLAAQGLADADINALLGTLAEPVPGSLAIVTKLATGGFNEEDLRDLVRELISALVVAAGLPADAPVLRDAIAALPRAVVVVNGSPTVNPNAIVAYLAEKYDVGEDGRPSIRGLLGLGPTPWVFELNGGVPQLDFSQGKIVADMTFGYATPKIGVVVNGAIDRYDISDAVHHADYSHYRTAADVWWLGGDAAQKIRFELRASGGFEYFDTTAFTFRNPLKSYYDFDSRVGRGAMLVGVRVGAPGDRLTLQVLAGGGLQFEDPNTLTFPAAQLLLKVDQKVTAQGTARIFARVIVVPQIFGVRIRGDATYYSLSRTEVTVTTLPTGGTQATLTAQSESQLDAHGRLFLDADVASVAGFVPAIFAGIDYLSSSGNGASLTLVAPVVGAGIVRHGW